MSAIERYRRRNVGFGLLVAGLALLATVALATAGSLLLLNSNAGDKVDNQALEGPVRRLPESKTALIGVVNGSGRITSVVALGLSPTGVGGAIMPISASADVGSGRAPTLRPLAAAVAQQGAESLLSGAEAITNISFDMAELIDAARYEALFGAVGPIELTLNAPVTDTSTGKSWEVGETKLEPGPAAELLTATNLYFQDWYQDPARYAVWRGVALATSGGGAKGAAAPSTTNPTPGTTPATSSGPPTATTKPANEQESAAPTNMDSFVKRLLAGPVKMRGLGITGIEEARVAEQLDPALKDVFGSGGVPSVVVHNASEAAIVGSAVAPGRVGATIDAPRYRLVAPFSAQDLQGRNFTHSDLVKEAIDRLSFSKVNIPSVVLIDQASQPETRVEVAKEKDLEKARAQAQELFGGTVEAVVASEPIVGIDVSIVLGRSYLESVKGPLTDFDGPFTMELSSDNPLSDSPAPTTTTTVAPTTTTTSPSTATTDGGDGGGGGGGEGPTTSSGPTTTSVAPSGASNGDG